MSFSRKSSENGSDGVSLPSPYGEAYFERGAVIGISGYMNYSWMPEATLRMAHYIIRQLPITQGQRVLDYGCAKGFLVKALRILDVDAWGVDLSHYAIEQAPSEVRKYCSRINGSDDPSAFQQDYDWLLSKDVFEHIAEDDLRRILGHARRHVKRMFAVIPLGISDNGANFVVPDYDRDITHITARTASWWDALFTSTGWTIDRFCYTFPGVKENWTQAWPEGNAFFVLS
jgi:cyclopropane fatty-acyl-phospholipid synthase-like methyltransferase